MYIYFDRNGTIKEVINDESIRKGSSDYNKIYCYLEGNPDIDDIWYLQKNPDGTLTNEVSFVDNIVTKSIPYDSKRDMKYFQDFEEYKFYVFTLSSSYLSQNGLVVATIRVAENNTLWALGELTFNVQANIVNSDNDITQSQYDYLLLTISSYYSKTEIDNKLNLKADKSDTYTKAQTDSKLDLKTNISSYIVVNWVDGAYIGRAENEDEHRVVSSSAWMYAIVDLPQAIKGKSIQSLFACMPPIKNTAGVDATSYFEDADGNIILKIGNYGTSESTISIPLNATKLYLSNRKVSSGSLTGVANPYIYLNTYIGNANSIVKELKNYNLSVGSIADNVNKAGKNTSSTTRARTDYLILDNNFDSILIDAGDMRLRNIYEYDTTETSLLSATQNSDGSLNRTNYDVLIWDRTDIDKYLLLPKPNKYYRLVFACVDDTTDVTQNDMNSVHLYGYTKGDILHKMIVGEDIEVNTTFTRGTIQDGNGMGNEVASTTRVRTSFIETANENIIEINQNSDFVIHNILCFALSNVSTIPMVAEKIDIPSNSKFFKFSTQYPYYRVIFRKLDNSDILASDVENAVTLYKRNVIETSEFRVVRVASSTATNKEKVVADYVCDGVNDELEIQLAINEVSTVGGTVKLSSGVFNIDAFQNSDTGGYSALVVPANHSYVRIEGIGIPQYWYNTTGTKLLLSSDAYNNVPSNTSEYQYTIIRGAYVSQTIQSHLNLELKDFAIQLPNNQKPITCVDTFYSNRIRMKRVNLWAFTDNTISIENPPSKAVQYCNGVRTVGGSNQSSITDYENVRVEGFYEGFKIGGEHIVMINAVAQYCVYGYTFGNFTWTNGYEHPDTLINCCDERNVNLPLFAGNVNATAIDFINFNIERIASATPDGVLGDLAKETYKGAFRGRIEYTMMTSWGGGSSVDTPFWTTDGSGVGFETINQAHLLQGTTALRLTYAPNYYQRYYDTDLQALMIYDGTKWNYPFDIPTVNDPTITFTQGGVTKGSISLNQATDQTIELDAGGSGGGSTVIANPTLSGDEAPLDGLEVDGTKYKVGGSGSSGSGGSEVHLYEHHIYTKSQATSYVLFVIYSNDNIPFTPDKIKQWLVDNNFTASYRYYPASGYFITGEVIIGIGVSGQFFETKTINVNESNVLSTDIKNTTSFYALSDDIIQIF